MENKLFDDVVLEYLDYLSVNENSSAYTMESVYRMHLKQFTKDLHLREVEVSTIRALQKEMLTKTYGKHKKLYSKKSINQVTLLFNTILNFAVRNEYIDHNPCKNFKMLKIVKKHKVDDVKFWTNEEFQNAIKYEKDIMYYTMIVLTYLTGMRKGEVRGLRWCDLDIERGYLTINQHIHDKKCEHQKHGEHWQVIEGRKNGDCHVVGLNESLLIILRKWKEQEIKVKGFRTNWYIFGRAKPVGQNTLNLHLEKIAKLSGEKRITVHGLRHAHASFLIYKGLNVYEIAERIGDTVQMVLDVYGHMFPNPQKHVVDVLNIEFANQFYYNY